MPPCCRSAGSDPSCAKAATPRSASKPAATAPQIRGERSQFKLPSENPQDFPPIAEFGESSYYEVSARLFRELIRRTIFATDNESSRYALGGIKLEWKDNVLTAVGTDGRRLAKMDGPAQAVGEPAPFGDVTVVPTRAMNLLERALGEDGSEVQIAVRQNDILVKNPRAARSTRGCSKAATRAGAMCSRSDRPRSRSDLTVGPVYSAVRQAAIVTSEESRGIDFTFGEGIARAGRPNRRSRPVAHRTADRLRRPRRSRSRSTPAS